MFTSLFKSNGKVRPAAGANVGAGLRPAPTPTPTPAPALIDLRGLTKIYNGQARPVLALQDIHLQVQPGEFLVITGKSGAGKTTLVNMLTGLDRCTSGEAWVAGAPLHRYSSAKAARWRGRTAGVIFQSFELLPTLSVLQNVTLPMDFAGKYSLRQRRQRAMQLLEQLDIAAHAHKLPSAVSGGQQQRVAIARALANDPPLLVADEPTGSLDSHTAAAVVALFAALSRQGTTIVLVTHDPDIARAAGRAIHLVDGRIQPLAKEGQL